MKLAEYVKEAAGDESVLLPITTLTAMSAERERLARAVDSHKAALAEYAEVVEQLRLGSGPDSSRSAG